MGVEIVPVPKALSHADTFEVLSLLEYCCQLWNPWNAKDIQAIEAVQRTFTYKIAEVQNLNYWERLHELKLYSLQRRREIIYIWKITIYSAICTWYNMAHNKKRKPSKTWTVCHRVIDYRVSNEQKLSTILSRKWNNYIWASRDIESVKTEKCKFELYNLPKLISDKPQMHSYVTTARSNSILDQLSYLGTQGIFKVVSPLLGLQHAAQVSSWELAVSLSTFTMTNRLVLMSFWTSLHDILTFN